MPQRGHPPCFLVRRGLSPPAKPPRLNVSPVSWAASPPARTLPRGGGCFKINRAVWGVPAVKLCLVRHTFRLPGPQFKRAPGLSARPKQQPRRPMHLDTQRQRRPLVRKPWSPLPAQATDSVTPKFLTSELHFFSSVTVKLQFLLLSSDHMGS